MTSDDVRPYSSMYISGTFLCGNYFLTLTCVLTVSFEDITSINL